MAVWLEVGETVVVVSALVGFLPWVGEELPPANFGCSVVAAVYVVPEGLVCCKEATLGVSLLLVGSISWVVAGTEVSLSRSTGVVAIACDVA